MKFQYNNQILDDKETIVCGIVNVTPDSFSDGGKWYGTDKAVKHAHDLVEQGAKMLDIGGESTRPGSTYVEIKEEIERIIPVIKQLKAENIGVPLSIDTWKAPVAKAAIEAGADIINDVTGLLGDPEMVDVIANSEAGAVLMFNAVIARPNHKGSQVFPQFGDGWAFSDAEIQEMEAETDIYKVVEQYFQRTLELAKKAGIPDERIMLDPGIGFGLSKRENLQLVRSVPAIHNTGYPAFVGVSRKRFVVNLLDEDGLASDPETDEGFENRDNAGAAITAIVAADHAEVVRVHVIKPHRIAALISDAVRLADEAENRDFGAYQNK